MQRRNPTLYANDVIEIVAGPYRGYRGVIVSRLDMNRLYLVRLRGEQGSITVYVPEYDVRLVGGQRNPASPVEAEKASKRFESFHDVPPNRQLRVSVPETPEVVWELGELIEVVYRPSRHSKRSGSDYQHSFPDFGDLRWHPKDRPILAVSPDGRQLYIIKNRSKFLVGERGIVG